MKLTNTLIYMLFLLPISSVFATEEVKTLNIGAAKVSYNYQPTDTGVETLTLVALVSETNNSLRGLKNMDQRRLSKLGQLIYQCKLIDAKAPILISKNYSLFTGVDLPLAPDERVGIQAEALQTVDQESLFSPTLGDAQTLRRKRETLDGSSAVNLKQFNVNMLHESDLISTAESIDIIARFPIFQLEKPVSRWSYNFNLRDFKQAIRHIDENCTPTRFVELVR